jgi:hypothetical protein
VEVYGTHAVCAVRARIRRTHAGPVISARDSCQFCGALWFLLLLSSGVR